MTAGRRRRVTPAASTAVAAAILLGSLPTAAAPATNGDVPTVRAETTVGGYLAGRHARTLHDYGASADLFEDALRLTPEAPVLLRDTHMALLLDGRIQDAAKVAIRGEALNVEMPYAQLTLTVDALVRGDMDTAAALAEAISGPGINRLLAPLLQAGTLAATGQSERVEEALQPLSTIRGTAALRLLHAALLADVAGDDAAATAAYAEAVAARETPSVRVVQLAGNFLERSGQREEALALYRAHLERRPDSVLIGKVMQRLDDSNAPPDPIVATHVDAIAESLFGVASAVSGEQTREPALIVARLGLALKPDFTMLQVLTGRLLEVLERYADANAMYAEIDPEAPLSWEVRIATADNLDRLDRFEDAEKLLRSLAEERPDNAEPMIELGDLLRRRQQFREAVDAYDAAFDRLPDEADRHWGLYYARGIALERSKLWDRAEPDFLKALELEPGQPLVLNYLGYSWIEQGRNLDQALDMIRRAVEARPDDGFITDSLGWAYYKLGDYDNAVEHLERAVLLQPEDPVINDHLGDAYWRVGRTREARFRWIAALGLDPEPEVREAIEAKLANGLEDPAQASAPAAE